MKNQEPASPPRLVCYGRFHGRLEQCPRCAYRNYCRDGGDPPLLADRAVQFEVEDMAAAPRVHRRHRAYSYDEMLDLLGFMLNLDYKTVNMLGEKLAAPELSMSEIGDKRKISRQAVHKFIQRRCREMPELAVVMQRRRIRIENNRNSTFMEAVCRIQQETREKRSQEQKPNSNSLSSLISLSRSLDLSRLSIGKGERTSQLI